MNQVNAHCPRCLDVVHVWDHRMAPGNEGLRPVCLGCWYDEGNLVVMLPLEELCATADEPLVAG